LLKLWLEAFVDLGGHCFEGGNLGAFPLLDELRSSKTIASEWDISSDFSLYALNSEAVMMLQERGVRTAALSIEDDATNISSILAHWPEGPIEPQVIVYKDTPLFIAEACSLTALHHGCPTAKVCGYRTLEIENEDGEKFFVAHESCKSVVYGKEAFALTQHRAQLRSLGVRRFRLDFLTRPYRGEEILSVVTHYVREQKTGATHSANFERELL
jgi:putative protease